MYFIPSERIKILCTDNPVDVTLPEMDKLRINTSHRSYSKSTLLRTYSVITVQYNQDLMSEVNLEYGYCDELSTKFNLSSTYLNKNFKHMVSHLDDLKRASHKISQVVHMVVEQEWKRLHSTSHNFYSVLVYICFLLIGLYVIYKLHNYLKGRIDCIKAITDTNQVM
jgi:hypothetical protein